MSARIGRAASAGFPTRQRRHRTPTETSVGARDPLDRRWQRRPHDQFCIVPGTSAPRSTSSRSATVTVLPYRLHQPPVRNGVLIVPGVALEPFAPGALHVSGNVVRRSRSATARARGVAPRFRRSILQASSPPENPASRHCAARRSKRFMVLAARAPISTSNPLPAHLSCVVFMVSGRRTALRGWCRVPGVR